MPPTIRWSDGHAIEHRWVFPPRGDLRAFNQFDRHCCCSGIHGSDVAHLFKIVQACKIPNVQLYVQTPGRLSAHPRNRTKILPVSGTLNGYRSAGSLCQLAVKAAAQRSRHTISRSPTSRPYQIANRAPVKKRAQASTAQYWMLTFVSCSPGLNISPDSDSITAPTDVSTPLIWKG